MNWHPEGTGVLGATRDLTLWLREYSTDNVRGRLEHAAADELERLGAKVGSLERTVARLKRRLR